MPKVQRPRHDPDALAGAAHVLRVPALRAPMPSVAHGSVRGPRSQNAPRPDGLEKMRYSFSRPGGLRAVTGDARGVAKSWCAPGACLGVLYTDPLRVIHHVATVKIASFAPRAWGPLRWDAGHRSVASVHGPRRFPRVAVVRPGVLARCVGATRQEHSIDFDKWSSLQGRN